MVVKLSCLWTNSTQKV